MIPYKQLKSRIDRDKNKKAKRREPFAKQYDDINKVFTPMHYIEAVRKCRKGVSFKLSVQRYCTNPLKHLLPDCDSMLAGQAPAITSSRTITIHERGKARKITPIHVADRVNQRVLCDHALVPMLSKKLIYDNGASMKDKGVGFARDRLNLFLEKSKREWDDDFYALCFDFEHFFDSVPHKLCFAELDKVFHDKQIVNIAMQIICGYQYKEAKAKNDHESMRRLENYEGVGMCLGSHISQIMALCVPNRIDHYIKDVCGMKYYVRYMDDGLVLHGSKKKLQQLKRGIEQICKQIGLKLNQKKTHIVHIRKGITFLKVRYFVRDHKTIRRLAKSSVVRQQRKLKRFVHLVNSGRMSLEDVYTSVQSWLGHTLSTSAYYKRKRVLRRYKELFDAYNMPKWRCYAV